MCPADFNTRLLTDDRVIGALMAIDPDSSLSPISSVGALTRDRSAEVNNNAGDDDNAENANSQPPVHDGAAPRSMLVHEVAGRSTTVAAAEIRPGSEKFMLFAVNKTLPSGAWFRIAYPDAKGLTTVVRLLLLFAVILMSPEVVLSAESWPADTLVRLIPVAALACSVPTWMDPLV